MWSTISCLSAGESGRMSFVLVLKHQSLFSFHKRMSLSVFFHDYRGFNFDALTIVWHSNWIIPNNMLQSPIKNLIEGWLRCAWSIEGFKLIIDREENSSKQAWNDLKALQNQTVHHVSHGGFLRDVKICTLTQRENCLMFWRCEKFEKIVMGKHLDLLLLHIKSLILRHIILLHKTVP